MSRSITKMHFPSQMIIAGDFRQAVQALPGKRILIIGSDRSCALANWQVLLPAAQVEVFNGSLPHSPEDVLIKATDLAESFDPDTYIAIGSGSAIDLAKAVVDAKPAEIVAIPTSLGGGEMTNVYGTRMQRGTKEGKGGLKYLPAKVFYDPALLASLPKLEMAASGINSFAHCIEAFYSTRSHWFGKAAAAQAGRMWPELLLAAKDSPIDETLGQRLFEAASLAGFAINTCGLGLHHAICHVVGGATGVTHGVINAIALPKSLKINREIAPEALRAAEIALGIDDLVAFSERLVAQLELPKNLKALSIPNTPLEPLVDALMGAHHLKFNPGTLDRVRAQRLMTEVFSG
ncbi:MAG: iron-containing alcohol dehydrogenase [Candidimonas sp.]|nr:iron-containing alcohol dehydrogenase [Candidimonas sp.]